MPVQLLRAMTGVMFPCLKQKCAVLVQLRVLLIYTLTVTSVLALCSTIQKMIVKTENR